MEKKRDRKSHASVNELDLTAVVSRNNFEVIDHS